MREQPMKCAVCDQQIERVDERAVSDDAGRLKHFQPTTGGATEGYYYPGDHEPVMAGE